MIFTLPETNIAGWIFHHFDGIYQERWGFSWAMLVSGRVGFMLIFQGCIAIQNPHSCKSYFFFRLHTGACLFSPYILCIKISEHIIWNQLGYLKRGYPPPTLSDVVIGNLLFFTVHCWFPPTEHIQWLTPKKNNRMFFHKKIIDEVQTPITFQYRD